MTIGTFNYLDPETVVASEVPFVKPWAKVDTDYTSFKQVKRPMPVTNMRGIEHQFGTDVTGFALYKSPSKVADFSDDAAIRSVYYDEIEGIIREQLPGVSKVVFFDHTIRRKGAARQPVQRVHVDQTPRAAVARVRRHLPAEEAEELLKGRFQILNAWRPIQNVASDSPLALIDWRSTSLEDLKYVDLLYPKRADGDTDDDERGREVRPDPATAASTDGYEVRGETFFIAPNEKHKWYYVKDMTPEEVLLFKMYDSRSQGQPRGRDGLAALTPHTAFEDPATPRNAPHRQSIEVRALVFYEEGT